MKARFTDDAVTLYDGDQPLYQLTHAAARELFGSLLKHYASQSAAIDCTVTAINGDERWQAGIEDVS